MRSILAISLALAACSKPTNCKLAVHKVLDITTHTGPKDKGPSPPDPKEEEVIAGIEVATVQACENEGLSDEQTACIMAMKSFEDLKTISTCPAIKAKHPSWVIAP